MKSNGDQEEKVTTSQIVEKDNKETQNC